MPSRILERLPGNDKYLGVTKVLCGFIQIVVGCRGILIMEAGFDSDTVSMGGILDPEF